MKIQALKANHLIEPLGFSLEQLSLSWKAADTLSQKAVWSRVEIAKDADFCQRIHDSGKGDWDSLGYAPKISLEAGTRYYWRVTVRGDKGDEAEAVSWFETGHGQDNWHGKWIGGGSLRDKHLLLRKKFTLSKPVKSARLYGCGLGLYELYVNGQKAGAEYLAPGFHAYDFWQQVQTYDITALLQDGGNAVGVMLGDGIYKGRYGFDGGYENIYGEEQAFIGDVVITYEDGQKEIWGTDADWLVHTSPIIASSIYDGEEYDAGQEVESWAEFPLVENAWQNAQVLPLNTDKLHDRLSPQVRCQQKMAPVQLIKTPKNELVLDFGQEITGWVCFKNTLPAGAEAVLEYGEILQDDCFYRDNLRTAKARFTYRSAGDPVWVRPHFTYYGFRYVRLSGWQAGQVKLEDFSAWVLYSDMEECGRIQTSNPLVNRLFLNAKWGQKGNFLDVPTDCPQRDERMGWTGDAQIFADTACYNMDAAAFFTKYMHDLRQEQKNLNGSVPYVVPQIKPAGAEGLVLGHGSTGWGDAAVIIPWRLYLHYGDVNLLAKHFPAMCDWVDYIYRIDEKTGGTRLWKDGFHFADWLALDAKDKNSPVGGTESYYVASAYYAYVAGIVSQAAFILHEDSLAERYKKLAAEIRAAIVQEYFTANGRCAIQTQTALILALYMKLVPEKFYPRLIADLREKLREAHGHLETGFVGTAYFCDVLSEYGADKEAYQLLLNEDYPGWLYAVKLGATTVWERWNSLLPDGKISGTGMNSLNHYAYGAIAGWMYREMCGIKPLVEKAGFRTFKLAPHPYGRLKWAEADFESPCGRIYSRWEICEDGSLQFAFEIPFGTEAEVYLPHHPQEKVLHLQAGKYEFKYQPTVNYILCYGSDSTVAELRDNDKTWSLVKHYAAELAECEVLLKYRAELKISEINPREFGLHIDWQNVYPLLCKKLNAIRKTA